MEFFDHPIAMLMVAIFSFPVYKMLAKVFFGENYEDLSETIKYVATADWYSLFKGKSTVFVAIFTTRRLATASFTQRIRL